MLCRKLVMYLVQNSRGNRFRTEKVNLNINLHTRNYKVIDMPTYITKLTQLYWHGRNA